MRLKVQQGLGVLVVVVLAFAVIVLFSQLRGSDRPSSDSGSGPGGPAPGAPVAGDVDGDGYADLLTGQPPTSQLYLTRGFAGGFRPVESIGPAPNRQAVRGDFDGDGRTDVATMARDNGVDVMRPLDGELEKWRTEEWHPQDPDGPRPGTASPADLDGDGRTDLLLAHPAQDRVWFEALLSTGTSFRSGGQWAVLEDTGLYDVRFLGADLTGDGAGDLVVLTEADPMGSGVWVLESGDGGFGPPTRWARGLNWSVPDTRLLAGDFDGDGTEDLGMVHDAGVPEIDVSLSTGRGLEPSRPWLDIATYARATGQVGDPESALLDDGARMVAADYDGDGRADLALQAETDEGLTDFRMLVSTGSSFRVRGPAQRLDEEWHDLFPVGLFTAQPPVTPQPYGG